MPTKMGNRILIVDDEADLREIIAFDLNLQGFETLEAENGRVAFEICQKNQVDLIISDLRMPGGDGMQMLRDVKRINPERPPVLLVTGFSDVASVEAYASGASALLAKPFERAEILRAVKRNLLPLQERFGTYPPTPLPAISLTFDALDFESLKKGAGGFLVPGDSPGLRAGDSVDFRVSFASGGLGSFRGSGCIRFVTESGTGVEIDTLESAGLEKYLEWLEANRPVSFIPTT